MNRPIKSALNGALLTYKEEVAGYGKVHVPAQVLPVAQGRHVPVGKVPVSGAGC